MKLQWVAKIVFLLLYSNSASANDNSKSEGEQEEVPSEYILPGYVMDNDAAIELLHRQTEMTYQLNLPKYLDEMKAITPNIRQQFDDKDFAIVGSLATLDATITFGEGIKNLQVIGADTQAGFEGLPNPENGKLHNHVQRLNALRNLVWLMKEKMKSGVVTADSSLMDKLKEAQTWLSTQTGGHLGQGMTTALEKVGIMDKLKAKWGANSLKFRTFSAAAANGLDFVINGYNTVVNSMAVNQKVTDANILALSSSVTAMAGDIAMGVSQIFCNQCQSGKCRWTYRVCSSRFLVHRILCYRSRIGNGRSGRPRAKGLCQDLSRASHSSTGFCSYGGDFRRLCKGRHLPCILLVDDTNNASGFLHRGYGN